MIQKRQLLDSTNLNNAFLSKNTAGEQTIASNLTASGGAITLKNTIFTDSANAGYLMINPQGNRTIIYDGVSNQQLDILSSSGSEYLSLSTINTTVSYAKIDAIGVDHLKINSGGKDTIFGGNVHLDVLQSTSPISILNGTGAQKVLTGGLLASGSYTDASKIPTYGVYSSGNIETAGEFVATGNNLTFPPVHSDRKINLWSGSNAHTIGTEAYALLFGGPSDYASSVGSKFYRGGGELIAQIGYGGSGTPANRLDSYFAGDVGIGGNIDMGGKAESLIYMGGVSAGSFGLAYNVTNKGHGLFYKEGTLDKVTLSPDGGGADGTALVVTGDKKVGIGTSAPAYNLDVTGTLRATSHIYAGGNIEMGTSGIINHTASDSYDKLRVWNSSSYTIGMKSAQTYGYLTDYAMTFTMSSTVGRGFLWRDVADVASDGAMSLTTDGRLYLKDVANVSSLYSRGVVDGASFNSRGDISASTTIVATGNITNGGFDFILGTSDQTSRGNTGTSRALVKHNGGVLDVNYGNDFIGGVRLNGKVQAVNSFILPVGVNKYAT